MSRVLEDEWQFLLLSLGSCCEVTCSWDFSLIVPDSIYTITAPDILGGTTVQGYSR